MAHIFGDLFDEFVSFGVNSRSIERVVTFAHADEAGGLFEGFGTESGNLEELCSRIEVAVCFAMGHNFFGHGGADASDVGEEFSRSGIEFDADAVDAAFDDFFEFFLEKRLVDVVLILSDTDGFGVDFDEFGEWVLKSSGDGNGAPDGQIQVGKFFAGQV